MKSGIFTTEFWLALSPIVMAIGEVLKDPPKTSSEAVMRFAVIISLALTSFGYSSSRARVKSSQAEAESRFISR